MRFDELPPPPPGFNPTEGVGLLVENTNAAYNHACKLRNFARDVIGLLPEELQQEWQPKWGELAMEGTLMSVAMDVRFKDAMVKCAMNGDINPERPPEFDL